MSIMKGIYTGFSKSNLSKNCDEKIPDCTDLAYEKESQEIY